MLAGGGGSSTDELIGLIDHHLQVLAPYEDYFAFPGPKTLDMVRRRMASGDFELLGAEMDRLEILLSQLGDGAATLADAFDLSLDVEDLLDQGRRQHYFTVLVADSLSYRQVRDVRREMRAQRGTDDEFIFELLPVPSIEDALAAVVANPQIQAVWIRGDVTLRSGQPLAFFRRRSNLMERLEESGGVHMHGPLLAKAVRELRPELDLYLTLDAEGLLTDPKDQALFNRVFYRREHPSEIHMATIDGVRRRYRTPFFDALKEYARRPIGNFHALPIARGNSVFDSRWIQDMADFYREHIFMAETSATVGGLDSLLSPTGSLREAQDKAARAFGAKQTFFATNGTSTSNKIVVQAVCRPGDIVLIDRDCHKSHHYGLVLSGAFPRVSGRLPDPGVRLLRRRAAAHDQAAAARAQARRQARRRPHAAADGLHVRRHRLQPHAGHGSSSGDQARHGVPVGRSVVRVRAPPPHLSSPRRHALRRAAAAAAGLRRLPAGVQAMAGGVRRARSRRRLHPAGPQAAARSGPHRCARLRDAVDAQVAVVAAAGIDDPPMGRAVRLGRVRVVPRGLLHPHDDVPELPDPRVAGPGSPAGGARGLRRDLQRHPDVARGPQPHPHRPAAEQVLPHPGAAGHDPGGIPGVRHHVVHRPRRHGPRGRVAVFRDRRAGSGPDPADARRVPHRHDRRRVQGAGADGQVRDPGEQDRPTRCVRDQHRYDVVVHRLPAGGLAPDRARAGRAGADQQPAGAGAARRPGAPPAQRAATVAELQRVPRRLPAPSADARGRHP